METVDRSRVSVILPTRDRGSRLAEALTSIQRVAERSRETASLEVIVISDGSGLPPLEPLTGLSIIHCPSTGDGLSAARNTGLRIARGQFVAFLDDHDAWAETHLVPHLALLTRNPRIDAVFSQYYGCSQSLQPTWGPGPIGPMPVGDGFTYLLNQLIPLGAWVIRRRVFDRVGFFNDYLSALTDWEFLLRLAASCDIHGLAVPSYLRRGEPLTGASVADWLANRRHADRAEQIISALRGRSPIPWSTRLRTLTRGTVSRGFDAWRALGQAEQAFRAGQSAEARAWLHAAWQTSPLHTVRLLQRFHRLLPLLVADESTTSARSTPSRQKR